jgi:hypothetical protein
LDNSFRNVVSSTGKLDSSKPTILPAGKYDLTDTKFPWMKGTLIVTHNKNNDNNSNLIVGGFYTPTNQVANKLDNDDGSHPGWLGYYTNEFPKNGFSIVSNIISIMLLVNIALEDFGPIKRQQTIRS